MLAYSVCARKGKGGIVRGLGISSPFNKWKLIHANRRSWQFVLDDDRSDWRLERSFVGRIRPSL